MRLQELKGLKYPDEYFIKFFFKFGLHSEQGKKYLELGCSNGCNIMLPYQFENEVVGVDMNPTLIEYAEHNFSLCNQKEDYNFRVEDMRNFCKEQKDLDADMLVLANSIYYIPEEDFIALLQNIVKNGLIKRNIPFFIRFRLPDDFRNHKGERISKNAIVMQNGITGEDSVFCRFYELKEMLEILQKELHLQEFQTMKIEYENIQNDVKVTNVDAVIWGTVN
jgi:hypothetical protein